jgi:cytochrome bd ubiquinol oxidase subunit I
VRGRCSVDVLDLSRLQFAVTASFHMTFPAVTVGLSLFLVLVYWLHMRTSKEVYMEIFRFWRNLFAIGFGLGIVSGIVLTFEFGMNWGPFSNATGPITGTLLALEVVTAFFLEAGFLGIMIYGEGRVGQCVMFFSTCMVALGAFISTTWILASNSWMQTPAGFTVIDGQFHPTDWMEAIFNPSFPLHYAHMVVATILSSALLVAGVGAWYLVKGRHAEFGRKTLSLGIGFLAVFAPLQLYTGDALGQRIVGPPPAREASGDGGELGLDQHRMEPARHPRPRRGAQRRADWGPIRRVGDRPPRLHLLRAGPGFEGDSVGTPASDHVDFLRLPGNAGVGGRDLGACRRGHRA